MFGESFSIYLGITVILFIFCIFLVIFAPKSKNFIKPEECPEFTKVIKSQEYLDALKESESIILNKDDSKNNNTKDNNTKDDLIWKKWPDSSIINGDVELLPIFIFSAINQDNLKLFSKLSNIIRDIPDVQSIYFLKLSSNSKFINHKNYSEIANKSLRYIYCFNAYTLSEDESGIWINSEAKKLSSGESYIYDSSKEHSLYNNTSEEVVYLIIDFDRPENIPTGYSEYQLSDDLRKKFNILLRG